MIRSLSKKMMLLQVKNPTVWNIKPADMTVKDAFHQLM